MRESKKVITIPNLLSLFRLFMLSFIIYFVAIEKNKIAFVIFLFAFLSDAVDGYIARKFEQVSLLGKILDPAVDKISVNAIAFLLAYKERIPWYAVITIFSRDLIIVVCALILMFTKIRLIPTSNNIGRATGVAFAVLLGAGILNYQGIIRIMNYAVIALIILSLYSYGRFFVEKFFRK